MRFLMLVILCAVSAAFAQQPSGTLPQFELFGGYSVNADFAKNSPVVLVVDQKVSPVFTLGSGPTGFEVSFKRYVHGGLGIKANVSGYSDVFRSGSGVYCQTTGCTSGLTTHADGRAFYLTAGPEWKVRRGKRFAPFAQALAGIVHESASFTMTESSTGAPFTGGVILFKTSGVLAGPALAYSDSNADTGLSLSLGGGLDIRMSKSLSFRAAMDYNPTFMRRPVIHAPIVDAQGQISLNSETPKTPIERGLQDHVRASVGIVWRFNSLRR